MHSVELGKMNDPDVKKPVQSDSWQWNSSREVAGVCTERIDLVIVVNPAIAPSRQLKGKTLIGKNVC
jgi:hypothetical protein